MGKRCVRRDDELSANNKFPNIPSSLHAGANVQGRNVFSLCSQIRSVGLAVGWARCRQRGPNFGHPYEMRFQGLTSGIDRKLHAVRLQAEAFQCMLSGIL